MGAEVGVFVLLLPKYSVLSSDHYKITAESLLFSDVSVSYVADAITYVVKLLVSKSFIILLFQSPYKFIPCKTAGFSQMSTLLTAIVSLFCFTWQALSSHTAVHCW